MAKRARTLLRQRACKTCWLHGVEVIGQIGAGGMGEVYRATDINLTRQVAIKVLPNTFANDPERLAV